MIIDELFEGPQLCPECGGICFSDLILAEKKDACYYKVKASAKVWPSAYASGRLVQCRKKGAANYGKSKTESVAEATGDEKFDTMMGRIQQEPKYPDPQMPPTDVKDLYQWAVKNNKPYHKIFAEWANREGFKSVAQALDKAGTLDSDALDYWTPDVWKTYWGEVRGIDSEMPPEWAKQRIPDELRDYLETVFDAYDHIVFDWPTEYRQIGQQGMVEQQELDEKWSQKYKKSINCANPKGFSQRAHCAGRKKNEDVAEAGPLDQRRNLPPLTGVELGGSQVPQFRLPIIPDNMPGGARMPGGAGLSRNIATQRSVGGKAIPSLGQPGKVVTSPTADKALTKLGGKDVRTTSGPTVTVQPRGAEYEPLASEVPAYVRKGLPDPVTTPVNKPKISVRPGETMDQAMRRTKAEQEFGRFLQGQSGQTFGKSTAGAGRGGQGGPTAAQSTADQVPTVKLPSGQTIPDPNALSPSGKYPTKSSSEFEKTMQKWDQQNNPVPSRGQRPWGSDIEDQPGWAQPQRPKAKPSMLSKFLGGGELEETSRKKREQPEVDYDDEYDAMVARVKKLAGLDPMKTVYDPTKRVYRNQPTAVQPPRQPKK